MKLRESQRVLRLDAAAETACDWFEGRRVAYLGSQLSLHLATDREEAEREAGLLHLPLPPEAASRQIQDAAEAWLRREAVRVLEESIARIAARLTVPAPALRLSFAARSHWVRLDLRGLCCNWRLIEQPAPVIDQALERVLATMAPMPRRMPDLFAAA